MRRPTIRDGYLFLAVLVGLLSATVVLYWPRAAYERPALRDEATVKVGDTVRLVTRRGENVTLVGSADDTAIVTEIDAYEEMAELEWPCSQTPDTYCHGSWPYSLLRRVR
jgi:hypothetical protein